jgi:hypothetical protein
MIVPGFGRVRGSFNMGFSWNLAYINFKNFRSFIPLSAISFFFSRLSQTKEKGCRCNRGYFPTIHKKALPQFSGKAFLF